MCWEKGMPGCCGKAGLRWRESKDHGASYIGATGLPSPQMQHSQDSPGFAICLLYTHLQIWESPTAPLTKPINLPHMTRVSEFKSGEHYIVWEVTGPKMSALSVPFVLVHLSLRGLLNFFFVETFLTTGSSTNTVEQEITFIDFSLIYKIIIGLYKCRQVRSRTCIN